MTAFTQPHLSKTGNLLADITGSFGQATQFLQSWTSHLVWKCMGNGEKNSTLLQVTMFLLTVNKTFVVISWNQKIL